MEIDSHASRNTSVLFVVVAVVVEVVADESECENSDADCEEKYGYKHGGQYSSAVEGEDAMDSLDYNLTGTINTGMNAFHAAAVGGGRGRGALGC